jgi:hypothetical protein
MWRHRAGLWRDAWLPLWQQRVRCLDWNALSRSGCHVNNVDCLCHSTSLPLPGRPVSHLSTLRVEIDAATWHLGGENTNIIVIIVQCCVFITDSVTPCFSCVKSELFSMRLSSLECFHSVRIHLMLKYVKSQGCTNFFKKSRRHVESPGARRVTRSKFYPDHQQMLDVALRN